MRRAALLAALVVAGCAADPPTPRDGAAPDPIAFFAGATHGQGKLKQVFKTARSLRVSSLGTIGKDGALTLTQDIAVEGSEVRRRTWTMRAVAPGRWTGQLTDAVGPVDVGYDRGRLRIDYAMKGGLRVQQWLVTRDACTLDNRFTVTKWAVPVARLHETIRRDAPPCASAPPR